MNVRKKIVIVSSGLRIGGVERSLIGLLGALDRNRYEVTLFLWRHDGEFMNMIPSHVKLLTENESYAALEKPIKDIIFTRSFPLAAARVLAKCVTYLRLNLLKVGGFLLPRSVRYCLPFLPVIPGEYDLALSFLTPHYPVVNKVIAKKRIGWIHTDYSAIESGVDRKLELGMWGGLDVIAAVSDHVKDTFCSVFPELERKCITIENILSSDFVRSQSLAENVRGEMPIIPGCFNICSVGRYSYQKNFDSIPGVVKKLIEIGLNVKWYIIGYGSDESLIRDKIAQAGVQDQVILLGKKTNPYPYIKVCDIYVQPSRYEGKAVTVREAQMLGKPVLITDFPTAKSQIVDHEDGLITPLSMDGIVSGVARLINDPKFREQIADKAFSKDYGNKEEVNKIYQYLV